MPKPADLLELDDTQAVEVRDDGFERREIEARIIPFGERIMAGGRPESFAPGLVLRDSGKVRLTTTHFTQANGMPTPIGKLVRVEERADGVYGIFTISRTPHGDEALTLARDGVLDVSAGFIRERQSQDGTVTQARLHHVTLTPFPAYRKAEVVAVRDNEGAAMPETQTAPTEEQTISPEDLQALQERQDAEFQAIRETLNRLQSSLDSPAPAERSLPTPFQWFRAQIDAVRGNTARLDSFTESVLQVRDLAGITGGESGPGDNTPADDLSGLVVESFLASQLVDTFRVFRPFYSNLGSFPMTRSGHAKVPVVKQHTKVDDRAGQLQEANSRKLITENVTFEAEWYDGAVQTALEVIAQSEIGVQSLIWDSLLKQYAMKVENASVAAVNAGGHGFAYTGNALKTDTWKNFVTDVVTQAIEVREQTGAPATKLALTKAQWIALVAMTDVDGRRHGASRGATNADMSVTLTAEALDLPGGILAFYTPNLDAAVLFNTQALRANDYGPNRVEALNVANMARETGIIGRATPLVPLIPTGVRVFGDDPESSS